jgi:uncharacterized membrane protein
MITEVNLFGVFINVGLVSAAAAALLLIALRSLLTAVGAYRWVWHPALVDVALFFLLWGLAACAESGLNARLISILG